MNKIYFESNQILEIEIKNKKYNINLNKCNLKFTSELIDITFIQFNDKEELINEKDLKFIESCDDDMNENELIYTIQYLKENEFNYICGRTKFINSISYLYAVPERIGSSGSLIIN
eukprot:jgi/Orpsp1_1/1179707/evm.model.c7180000070441.1